MELLRKQKVEKEDEHYADLEEVIADAKTSVVMAILEAMIKLAEDLENGGSWDVDDWREALGKLIGNPATANQDPVLLLTEGWEKKDMTDDDQAKV